MSFLDQKALARFEAKISKNAITGCWVWVGGRNQNGYGRFWLDGKLNSPHRISYLHYVGLIPRRRVVDHKCNNKSCVRPDHLEPVTQRENIRRGWAGKEPTGVSMSFVDELIKLAKDSRREHEPSCPDRTGCGGPCFCPAGDWNARVDAVLGVAKEAG